MLSLPEKKFRIVIIILGPRRDLHEQAVEFCFDPAAESKGARGDQANAVRRQEAPTAPDAIRGVCTSGPRDSSGSARNGGHT